MAILKLLSNCSIDRSIGGLNLEKKFKIFCTNTSSDRTFDQKFNVLVFTSKLVN